MTRNLHFLVLVHDYTMPWLEKDLLFIAVVIQSTELYRLVQLADTLYSSTCMALLTSSNSLKTAHSAPLIRRYGGLLRNTTSLIN